MAFMIIYHHEKWHLKITICLVRVVTFNFYLFTFVFMNVGTYYLSILVKALLISDLNSSTSFKHVRPDENAPSTASPSVQSNEFVAICAQSSFNVQSITNVEEENSSAAASQQSTPSLSTTATC